ncbi:MAG TPA: DoxX family protein [Terracidiphilus sp.]|jgi:putative oxidoreductase|nr:DoxX family protein [Terracidiphilus sp.]
MFETTRAHEHRDRLGDWVLRGGVALAFVLFGADKFPSQPGSVWVRFFDQVGVGQWFRYFTGIVEIAGALFVLIPQTARIGLALLATTMACAAGIVSFRLGRPADGIFAEILCVVLSALWWARRSPDPEG